MWYEKFDFEEDPYTKKDPFLISLKRIVWDRPDLANAKVSLDSFLKDVADEYRVGLKIYGPHGSGKTWLLRLIQKLIQSKKSDALTIYTKIPYLEASFSTLYQLFMMDLHKEEKLTKIINGISQKTGRTVVEWMGFLGDRDLAQCLHNIKHGNEAELSKGWLFGQGLSLSDVKRAKIYVKLDGDYEKFRVMHTILGKSSLAFSTSVVLVDELENADPSLAKRLSDALRDLLDGFSQKFALVTSYTAQREENWFDYGYSGALARRFDYTIDLRSLNREDLPQFLRQHNQAYRKENSSVEDQIYPFSEEAIYELFDNMEIGYRYPGFILPNCGIVGRDAAERDVEINPDLITQVKSHLQWIKKSA